MVLPFEHGRILAAIHQGALRNILQFDYIEATKIEVVPGPLIPSEKNNAKPSF